MREFIHIEIREIVTDMFFYVFYKLKGRHTKKVFFFSGRTTKRVGRVNPPDHQAKKHFFSYKWRKFSPKIGKKLAWTTKPLG